jgi:hypothetical protein
MPRPFTEPTAADYYSFACEARGGASSHRNAALHQPTALLRILCGNIPFIAFHMVFIVSNAPSKVNPVLPFWRRASCPVILKKIIHFNNYATFPHYFRNWRAVPYMMLQFYP